MLKLHSAEYEDHRVFRVSTKWIKMYYLHKPGVTNVILGDGYPTDEYPVECIPVTETPEYIDECYEAAWPGCFGQPRPTLPGLEKA